MTIVKMPAAGLLLAILAALPAHAKPGTVSTKLLNDPRVTTVEQPGHTYHMSVTCYLGGCTLPAKLTQHGMYIRHRKLESIDLDYTFSFQGDATSDLYGGTWTPGQPEEFACVMTYTHHLDQGGANPVAFSMGFYPVKKTETLSIYSKTPLAATGAVKYHVAGATKDDLDIVNRYDNVEGDVEWVNDTTAIEGHGVSADGKLHCFYEQASGQADGTATFNYSYYVTPGFLQPVKLHPIVKLPVKK